LLRAVKCVVRKTLRYYCGGLLRAVKCDVSLPVYTLKIPHKQCRCKRETLSSCLRNFGSG